MQIRLATSLTAAAVLMCSLATTARPAAAAVITFEFTGTSNTFGREVFGENGELVPYSDSFIYETSLAAQTDLIPAGSGVRHDFYGYSAAGIVACNLTFGNSTWTPDGINPLRSPGTSLISGSTRISRRTRQRGSSCTSLSMTTSTMTPVPEPASLLFVGSGLLGVVARHRMSKKR